MVGMRAWRFLVLCFYTGLAVRFDYEMKGRTVRGVKDNQAAV